jgi:hypothetical protein
MAQNEQKKASAVIIDLEEELTAEELSSFKARAEESGAESLSEYFKAVFLRPRVHEVERAGA